jgi:hypothetical protein
MRIRILLFSPMRFQIQFLKIMRIRIRNLALLYLRHLLSDLLQFWELRRQRGFNLLPWMKEL